MSIVFVKELLLPHIRSGVSQAKTVPVLLLSSFGSVRKHLQPGGHLHRCGIIPLVLRHESRLASNAILLSEHGPVHNFG